MSGHWAYVAGAYGLTACLLGAMVARVAAEHRSLRRALARLGVENGPAGRPPRGTP